MLTFTTVLPIPVLNSLSLIMHVLIYGGRFGGRFGEIIEGGSAGGSAKSMQWRLVVAVETGGGSGNLKK